MMVQVYVDMDGVLADFDRGYAERFGATPSKAADNVDWQLVARTPNFYRDLPPMVDMHELWDFVRRLTPHPIVLTGIPSSVAEAAGNKWAWARKNLGDHVEVRCCLSKEKCLHAKPGDVLIDDWDKYRALWIAQGGRWVLHTSAENSIQQLIEMGLWL